MLSKKMADCIPRQLTTTGFVPSLLLYHWVAIEIGRAGVEPKIRKLHWVRGQDCFTAVRMTTLAAEVE